MFQFLRRRKRKNTPSTECTTTNTFVEATGGGWGESPDVVAADGGQQADFVGRVLEEARAFALDNDIPVGGEFEFKISNIPMGIDSPHEIVFGLMMRASEVGLGAGMMRDEYIYFTRVS